MRSAIALEWEKSASSLIAPSTPLPQNGSAARAPSSSAGVPVGGADRLGELATLQRADELGRGGLAGGLLAGGRGGESQAKAQGEHAGSMAHGCILCPTLGMDGQEEAAHEGSGRGGGHSQARRREILDRLPGQSDHRGGGR